MFSICRIGFCIWLTSCRNEVITPKVIAPLRSCMAPQMKAMIYPRLKLEPINRREITVNLARRLILPRRSCCMSSRRLVIQSPLSKERSTALCSIVSCTSIWITLSCLRMSSVIILILRPISFPTIRNIGVSSSSAHASRVSIDCISRKAPTSCISVTVISGKSDVVASLTTSISFSKREVTSPECISFWSNI